jgi:hypothetical protein
MKDVSMYKSLRIHEKIDHWEENAVEIIDPWWVEGLRTE